MRAASPTAVSNAAQASAEPSKATAIRCSRRCSRAAGARGDGDRARRPCRSARPTPREHPAEGAAVGGADDEERPPSPRAHRARRRASGWRSPWSRGRGRRAGRAPRRTAPWSPGEAPPRARLLINCRDHGSTVAISGTVAASGRASSVSASSSPSASASWPCGVSWQPMMSLLVIRLPPLACKQTALSGPRPRRPLRPDSRPLPPALSSGCSSPTRCRTRRSP